MIGRFCHFYPGYTVTTALAEPWARFLVMLKQIGPLAAEDDLRALSVAGIGANPGEKGRQFERFAKDLRKQAGGSIGAGKSTLIPGIAPMTSVESVPGEITKMRERQKQAAIELEAKHGRHKDGADTTTS